MKYLIVLSSLFMIAYGLSSEAAEAMKRYGKQMTEQCMAEIDATYEDIAPILHYTLPTTEKGKCFLACIHKITGCQDVNGKINKAGTLAAIEKLKDFDEEFYDKIKQIVEICMEKVNDLNNECETALAMLECAQAEKDKVGLPNIGYN